MHIPIRTPSEPEQANHNPRAPYHGAVESMLGLNDLLASRDGVLVFALVDCAVDEDAGETAEQDTDTDDDES